MGRMACVLSAKLQDHAASTVGLIVLLLLQVAADMFRTLLCIQNLCGLEDQTASCTVSPALLHRAKR